MGTAESDREAVVALRVEAGSCGNCPILDRKGGQRESRSLESSKRERVFVVLCVGGIRDGQVLERSAAEVHVFEQQRAPAGVQDTQRRNGGARAESRAVARRQVRRRQELRQAVPVVVDSRGDDPLGRRGQPRHLAACAVPVSHEDRLIAHGDGGGVEEEEGNADAAADGGEEEAVGEAEELEDREGRRRL